MSIIEGDGKLLTVMTVTHWATGEILLLVVFGKMTVLNSEYAAVKTIDVVKWLLTVIHVTIDYW